MARYQRCCGNLRSLQMSFCGRTPDLSPKSCTTIDAYKIRRYCSCPTPASSVVSSMAIWRNSHQRHSRFGVSLQNTTGTRSAACHAIPATNTLYQGIAANPGLFLLGIAAIVLGTTLSVFLFAAIPTIMAMRQAALAAQSLMTTVEAEVPDTAAALRLSGFELSDCIEEVALLSADLTQGVRASARAMATAEQGLRGTANLAAAMVSDAIIPAVKGQVPAAKEAMEDSLKERARLQHTGSVLMSMAGATKTMAQQARVTLAAATVAAKAVAIRRMARRSRRETLSPEISGV